MKENAYRNERSHRKANSVVYNTNPKPGVIPLSGRISYELQQAFARKHTGKQYDQKVTYDLMWKGLE